MAWSSDISVVNCHSARSGKTHQGLPLRPPSSDNVASRVARLPKVTPGREIWRNAAEALLSMRAERQSRSEAGNPFTIDGVGAYV